MACVGWQGEPSQAPRFQGELPNHFQAFLGRSLGADVVPGLGAQGELADRPVAPIRLARRVTHVRIVSGQRHLRMDPCCPW
jgi:hypothetical protein